jgi:cell division protein FtsW (lipid II flippase)
MQKSHKLPVRLTEGLALLLVGVIAFLGFLSTAAAIQVRSGQDPLPGLSSAFLPPLLVVISIAAFHFFLIRRRFVGEQIIFPAVCLLIVIGLLVIFRLRGLDGFFQQFSRGFLPGLILAGIFIAKPQLIEMLRRWAVPIGLIGLLLPFATAFFGVVDETGARLALKLGPLPSIQTSELIKISLIIFLACYIERQGKAAEGRSRAVFGWFRIPALQYFIPGVLFAVITTLALVLMSDYGAVLILGSIFIAMLYAGFETRIFTTVSLIGLGLLLLTGIILSLAWKMPAVIQYRFIAFLDPWSTEVITIDGISTGITISEGPGYQLQQAIYAIISGGVIGKGLGLGSPYYVPLAHSDFILAAIIEELGAVIGVPVLLLFAVIMMRIIRISFLLPSGQIFERLLLVGIGVHLFIQVFVMGGGTLNLLPVTGVTIPFVSQGGVALLVNLAEIGMALAILRRQESIER